MSLLTSRKQPMQGLANPLKKMPREQRDVLFILLTLLFILIPHFFYLPIWASVISVLTIGWRAILARYNMKLPGKVVKFSLLGIFLALIVLNYRSIAGPLAGDTLLVMLISLKTLELRARRDALAIFYFGLFLILMGLTHSQGILMAVSMLVALTALLTALTNANMPAGYPPLKDAFRVAMRLMLWGMPLMIVLFMIFPRLDPLWALPNFMLSKTGVSDSLTINSISSLVQDDSIAFRVKFNGKAPGQNDLYFRGPVLSYFDGSRWLARDFIIDTTRNPTQAIGFSSNDAPLEYEVTMEMTNQPWLFTLDFTPPQSAPNFLNSSYRVILNQSLQWTTHKPINERAKYSAAAYLQYKVGVNMSQREKEAEIRLPKDSNPLTQKWAQELMRDSSFAALDNKGKANWVLNHINQNEFFYTLSPPVGYGAETAADQLWFDYQSGFCEHYASGFVILMRYLGVPARIVTGYMGAQPNLLDQYWVVRQSNAHAWAEIWQPEEGWIRIDPTAAIDESRIESGISTVTTSGAAMNFNYADLGLMQKLKMRWEALENAWNQRVLGYSIESGIELLQWLGLKKATWLTLIGSLFGFLGGLVGIYFIILKIRAPKQDPWVKVYQMLRTKLEKIGISSTPATGPRTLAQQLNQATGKKAKPETLQQIKILLHDLESLRYSSNKKKKLSLKKIKTGIQKLRI